MFLTDTNQSVRGNNTKIRNETTALALRLDTPSGAPAAHRRPPVTSRLPGRPLHVLVRLPAWLLSRMKCLCEAAHDPLLFTGDYPEDAGKVSIFWDLAFETVAGSVG